MRLARQIVENGAVGPRVTGAAVDQVRPACCCIACIASMRAASSSACRCAMRRTLALAAPAVLPQAHQLGDLFHGKAEVARALDEAQRVDLGLGVLAVAACRCVAREGSRPSDS
jgi:hypothetical protein